MNISSSLRDLQRKLALGVERVKGCITFNANGLGEFRIAQEGIYKPTFQETHCFESRKILLSENLEYTIMDNIIGS